MPRSLQGPLCRTLGFIMKYVLIFLVGRQERACSGVALLIILGELSLACARTNICILLYLFCAGSRRKECSTLRSICVVYSRLVDAGT
jgi:hypothetical protein